MDPRRAVSKGEPRSRSDPRSQVGPYIFQPSRSQKPSNKPWSHEEFREYAKKKLDRPDSIMDPNTTRHMEQVLEKGDAQQINSAFESVVKSLQGMQCRADAMVQLLERFMVAFEDRDVEQAEAETEAFIYKNLAMTLKQNFNAEAFSNAKGIEIAILDQWPYHRDLIYELYQKNQEIDESGKPIQKRSGLLEQIVNDAKAIEQGREKRRRVASSKSNGGTSTDIARVDMMMDDEPAVHGLVHGDDTDSEDSVRRTPATTRRVLSAELKYVTNDAMLNKAESAQIPELSPAVTLSLPGETLESIVNDAIDGFAEFDRNYEAVWTTMKAEHDAKKADFHVRKVEYPIQKAQYDARKAEYEVRKARGAREEPPVSPVKPIPPLPLEPPLLDDDSLFKTIFDKGCFLVPMDERHSQPVFRLLVEVSKQTEAGDESNMKQSQDYTCVALMEHLSSLLPDRGQAISKLYWFTMHARSVGLCQDDPSYGNIVHIISFVYTDVLMRTTKYVNDYVPPENPFVDHGDALAKAVNVLHRAVCSDEENRELIEAMQCPPVMDALLWMAFSPISPFSLCLLTSSEKNDLGSMSSLVVERNCLCEMLSWLSVGEAELHDDSFKGVLEVQKQNFLRATQICSDKSDKTGKRLSRMELKKVLDDLCILMHTSGLLARGILIWCEGSLLRYRQGFSTLKNILPGFGYLFTAAAEAFPFLTSDILRILKTLFLQEFRNESTSVVRKTGKTGIELAKAPLLEGSDQNRNLEVRTCIAECMANFSCTSTDAAVDLLGFLAERCQQSTVLSIFLKYLFSYLLDPPYSAELEKAIQQAWTSDFVSKACQSTAESISSSCKVTTGDSLQLLRFMQARCHEKHVITMFLKVLFGSLAKATGLIPYGMPHGMPHATPHVSADAAAGLLAFMTEHCQERFIFETFLKIMFEYTRTNFSAKLKEGIKAAFYTAEVARPAILAVEKRYLRGIIPDEYLIIPPAPRTPQTTPQKPLGNPTAIVLE